MAPVSRPIGMLVGARVVQQLVLVSTEHVPLRLQQTTTATTTPRCLIKRSPNQQLSRQPVTDSPATSPFSNHRKRQAHRKTPVSEYREALHSRRHCASRS